MPSLEPLMDFPSATRQVPGRGVLLSSNTLVRRWPLHPHFGTRSMVRSRLEPLNTLLKAQEQQKWKTV